MQGNTTQEQKRMNYKYTRQHEKMSSALGLHQRGGLKRLNEPIYLTLSQRQNRRDSKERLAGAGGWSFREWEKAERPRLGRCTPMLRAEGVAPSAGDGWNQCGPQS